MSVVRPDFMTFYRRAFAGYGRRVSGASVLDGLRIRLEYKIGSRNWNH